MERMIVSNGGNPGLRAWWERRKETMSHEFRTWYDAQDLAESGHLFEPFKA